MKKERIIFIISLITMIISSIISVYAASYLYNSNEVSYNNTSSGITSDNVQGAIDELYTEATNYNTLSAKVGSDTLTTTTQDLSGAVNELNSRVTKLENKNLKTGSASTTVNVSNGERKNYNIYFTDNINTLLAVWCEVEQSAWIMNNIISYNITDKYFRFGITNQYTSALNVKVTVHYLYY